MYACHSRPSTLSPLDPLAIATVPTHIQFHVRTTHIPPIPQTCLLTPNPVAKAAKPLAISGCQHPHNGARRPPPHGGCGLHGRSPCVDQTWEKAVCELTYTHTHATFIHAQKERIAKSCQILQSMRCLVPVSNVIDKRCKYLFIYEYTHMNIIILPEITMIRTSIVSFETLDSI